MSKPMVPATIGPSGIGKWGIGRLLTRYTEKTVERIQPIQAIT
jgi:hypothetical protein